MGQLSRLLRNGVDNDGTKRLTFRCPGCTAFFDGQPMLSGMANHSARISGPRAWAYNGNPEAPTFSPSMLVETSYWKNEAWAPYVCHSFVTDGRIMFLDDCTHALRGTHDLVAWPYTITP